MKANYKTGLDLIQSEQYQEAYEYFSNILKKNVKDYPALYYRGMVDFFHLRQNFEQTFSDFQFLINNKTPFGKSVLGMAALVADVLNRPKEVIDYGMKALGQDQYLDLDLNFALARSYVKYDKKEHYLKALQHIDVCINTKLEVEVSIDYYFLKCQILLSLEEFDKLDDLIKDVTTNFGHGNGTYYFTAASEINRIKEIVSDEDRNSLYEGIRKLEIACQYDENETSTKFLMAETYARLGDFEKAFSSLDLLINVGSQEDIDVEKMELYERYSKIDELITFCKNRIQKNPSPKLSYMLGFHLFQRAKTDADLEEALALFKESYEQSFYALDYLARCYRYLKRPKELQPILVYLKNKYPNEGFIDYLLADNAKDLNKSLNDYVKHIRDAYQNNYLNRGEYVNYIYRDIESTKEIKSDLIMQNNAQSQYLDTWTKRQVAIRSFFGDYEARENHSKALQLIRDCLQENNYSCMLTLMGRFKEHILKNHQDAYKYYLDAYNEYLKTSFHSCNCARSNMIHVYIKGIGTPKDETKAKQMLLDAYQKDGMHLCGEESLLYTYYALQEEPGFNLETANQLLKREVKFSRYDISRLLMLKRIEAKSGKSISQYDKIIKQALKFNGPAAKNYYKENKNREVIYPHYTSF